MNAGRDRQFRCTVASVPCGIANLKQPPNKLPRNMSIEQLYNIIHIMDVCDFSQSVSQRTEELLHWNKLTNLPRVSIDNGVKVGEAVGSATPIFCVT